MTRKSWDGAEVLFWPLLFIIGGIIWLLNAVSFHHAGIALVLTLVLLLIVCMVAILRKG